MEYQEQIVNYLISNALILWLVPSYILGICNTRAFIRAELEHGERHPDQPPLPLLAAGHFVASPVLVPLGMVGKIARLIFMTGQPTARKK